MAMTGKDLADMLRAGGEARRQTVEECAAAVEAIKLSEVMLACGELTAGERRLVKAMLPWVANRIRKL